MSHRVFNNGVLRDRTATRTIEVNQGETIRLKVTFGNHTFIIGPVSFVSFEEARARHSEQCIHRQAPPDDPDRMARDHLWQVIRVAAKTPGLHCRTSGSFETVAALERSNGT